MENFDFGKLEKIYLLESGASMLGSMDHTSAMKWPAENFLEEGLEMEECKLVTSDDQGSVDCGNDFYKFTKIGDHDVTHIIRPEFLNIGGFMNEYLKKCDAKNIVIISHIACLSAIGNRIIEILNLELTMPRFQQGRFIRITMAPTTYVISIV